MLKSIVTLLVLFLLSSKKLIDNAPGKIKRVINESYESNFSRGFVARCYLFRIYIGEPSKYCKGI